VDTFVQTAPAEVKPRFEVPWKAEPAGALVTRTIMEKVSLPAAVYGALTVTGTVVATPTCAPPGTVPTVIAVGIIVAALAGATDDKSPKPIAETATSAMRLRVVFVDICFLSLVVKKTFSFTAGKEKLFAS